MGSRQLQNLSRHFSISLESEVTALKVYVCTRWFKYDLDDLCVNKCVNSPGHIWTTLYFPHNTSTFFSPHGFRPFPGVSPALQDATACMLVTTEVEKLWISSQSFDTWSLFCILIVCKKKFFSNGKSFLFFSHQFFFFRVRIIQRILMVRNKSFIVYCTIHIRMDRA